MKKVLLILTMLTTGFCNMWADVSDYYLDRTGWYLSARIN